MGEPTEVNRRFVNLTEAEAQAKREKENMQERNRQSKIAQAFSALYRVLPYDVKSKQPPKLDILKTAKEHILHINRAKNIKTPVAKSSVPRAEVQQRSVAVQTTSDLSLTPDAAVMKDRGSLMMELIDLILGSDQNPITENDVTSQVTNNPGMDQTPQAGGSSFHNMFTLEQAREFGGRIFHYVSAMDKTHQVDLSILQNVSTVDQAGGSTFQNGFTMGQDWSTMNLTHQVGGSIFQNVPTVDQTGQIGGSIFQNVPPRDQTRQTGCSIVQNGPTMDQTVHVAHTGISNPAQCLPQPYAPQTGISNSAQFLPQPFAPQTGISNSAQCLPQPYAPQMMIPIHGPMRTPFTIHVQSNIPTPVLHSVPLSIPTPTAMQAQYNVQPVGPTSNQGYVLQDMTRPTEDIRLYVGTTAGRHEGTTGIPTPSAFW